MPSGVTVDLCMDALAAVMLDALSGVGIEGLADVRANSFTVVMTAALEFPVSTPLEECSR